MRRILLNRTRKSTYIAGLFMLFSLIFSTPALAEETDCGQISGFEFSNGNSTTAIVNDDEYFIGDLPSNFYVDLIVSGYTQSASFKLKNKDTGQEYTIGENTLPYTFPGGNGAWSYGTGEFEVEAKIFKYNNCAGSYCDKETIKFTITDSPPCGTISGFAFSNGSSTVSIANDQEYFIGDLPSNFYVDVLVNGYSQSALIKVKNEDTGQEYTIGENTLPYTAPGGNAAWSYGAGEFKVESKIFKYDNCAGSYCDNEYIKFTITDTPPCGTIAGFAFSNGNSSVSITDDATYALSELPNNFYVDVLVNGYSESASIKVKNEDTGQEYTIGENALPYTFPAGNGAWNLPAGEYKVEAKIFKFDNCAGSYCDSEYIKFTITNTPSCGQIDGLAFSNGTNTVNIANGGSYDIASLPYNFYVDVVVSGMTESAFNRVTNLDTGAVYTNGENVLPYTYPSGNQAWTLGTGTFQFYSEIFKYDNCAGTKCDHICITFTIFEDTCGDITEFQFSNGSDPATTIVDGGLYNINDLPSGFYVDAIVNGNSDSLRFEVTNTETGEVYNIIENYLPYTFPAGNGAWFLGAGTFEVKGSLFTGNYCNGTLCDEDTITFTIGDGPDALCEAEAGTTNTDGSLFLIIPGTNPRVEIIPGQNAVLPTGYDYCTVISTGPNATIISWESGLSAELTQAGVFGVHLAVYNPLTLDLNTIVSGVTTAADILNTIDNNDICASLDAVGTDVTVILGGIDERAAATDTKDTKSNTADATVILTRTEDIIEDASVDIKLYPNPAITELNIELLLLDAEVMNYNMYDLNGRQVLSGSFDNSTLGRTKVDTEALSTGLYVIKFESSFRSFNKKVQVSK